MVDTNRPAAPVSTQKLLVEHEPLSPWLAASLLASGASIAGAVFGYSGHSTRSLLLLIVTATTLAATLLVWLRARGALETARREERARPATDELKPQTSAAVLAWGDSSLPPYAEGMLRYATAVVELLEHSLDVALGRGDDTTALAAARDDAVALVSLLHDMAAQRIRLDQAARVHTICMLWESTQQQIEADAAALDPEYHQRWRARHVAVIRLRRGERPERLTEALPFRA